ncbi:MAG: glycoside hydrolase family 3 C-terminal domain-containing protein [Clostridia bacterium]|nr:glycoside hydrolase family 3 C-terminal domain-containing protein [Clostridia bacterium]
MKRLFSRALWGALSVVLSTVLVISLLLNYVAGLYSVQLHGFFGTRSFEIIEDANADKTNTQYWATDYGDKDALREHIDDVVKRVEGEGLVLMKNDGNFLPLNTSPTSKKRVSLLGHASVDVNASMQGTRKPNDDVFTSFKDALSADDIEVNPTLWNFYADGIGSSYGLTINNKGVRIVNEAPWSAMNYDTRASIEEYGDAAILVLSREGSEGMIDLPATGSDTVNGDYLALSQAEIDLLTELTKLKNSNKIGGIVVILNSAAPIQLDFLDNNQISVDSIMWIGNVGSAGIFAVADALVGKINPSVKISDIYVKDNFSSPAMASWILSENMAFSQVYENASQYNLDDTQADYGVYVEGVYVGYRYYETRYADVVEGYDSTANYNYENKVAYPFGYGLSYTEFSYENFGVEDKGDAYEVSVTVKNSGQLAGKEAVQVYLQKPYDVDGYDSKYNVEKPAVELAGFAKTSLLQPEGSEEVKITVEKSQFASYDAYGAKTYILSAGDYYLSVGRDSHDALNNILAAKGKVLNMTSHYEIAADEDIGDKNLAEICFTKDSLDKETFRYSRETGEEITNRLDDSDMNLYSGRGDNKVTYVSRRDWVKTWPTEAVRFSVTDQMSKDLKNAEAPSSDGVKMPAMGAQNGITIIMLSNRAIAMNENGEPVPYNDEQWDLLLDELSFDDLNDLVTKGYVTTAAIASVGKPETDGSDLPTGIQASVTRGRFPNEGIWAATFNVELLEEIGDCLAEDALFVGKNALWMPGMNIHRTPYGCRAHEYFSEDPYLTGIMAMHQIKAMQNKGVVAYPKHFVLNDQETQRSGICTWVNEQEAREIMLAPWKYALSAKRGNSHALMSSFNRVGCKWSSAVKGLMTDILRSEFGFDGFVLTDMVDGPGKSYMTLLDGIMAGTDLWFNGADDFNLNAYKNNAAVVSAMRESAHRILYVTANYSAAMNGWSSDTKIVNVTPWWQKTINAVVIISGILTALTAGLYVTSYVLEFKLKRKR